MVQREFGCVCTKSDTPNRPEMIHAVTHSPSSPLVGFLSTVS
ncbi:hypothetical protein RMSM_07688 [Rhodopirellula maiorica SM1]|uniref:Uncharacterized protein n=1 Tax=Rhodopirellula maiorica SM1 TaxID=1265738 RepID=M5RN39_9BACT|nr:hypothetical protein RMSM_07688 [Rhodopirellula maiorica SM1]